MFSNSKRENWDRESSASVNVGKGNTYLNMEERYYPERSAFDDYDSMYGPDEYDSSSQREVVMAEHLLELEREVLYLKALIKQLEEGLVPQVDDLRNRLDAVMQVLWNTGAVG